MYVCTTEKAGAEMYWRATENERAERSPWEGSSVIDISIAVTSYHKAATKLLY